MRIPHVPRPQRPGGTWKSRAPNAALAGSVPKCDASGSSTPMISVAGIPTRFFPQRERRVDLELAETRTFSSTVVYRPAAPLVSVVSSSALGWSLRCRR